MAQKIKFKGVNLYKYFLQRLFHRDYRNQAAGWHSEEANGFAK